MAFNIMDLLGYGNKPYVEGTWGPTSGFLGALNPFARDYGYSEAGREFYGKTPSAEVTTKFNNPKVYQNLIASGAPLPEGYNSSRLQELKNIPEQDLNPAQKTELENLEKPNPTPDNNTVLDELRRERDRQLADLEDAFNMANRYASDARNTLARRRKGFEEDYSNSAADIYNQFGADRAGLQTSAEGQDARTTRGLLAQGIGGSGLQEALRRNEAARQQNYGQVREGRLADERINERNKNERMSWADEQDAAINRYLEQAAMQREQGRRTTLDNFSNTLGKLITQAQAAANALQLSGQDIGSTQIAGIPLAGLTNGTFLNDLQQAYQGSLGGNQSTDTNVNMNLENLPLTEEEKRRRGLLL
ncbi:MAG: hypothetical protein GX625_21655 [Clostridiaceae bacterium]|nr:hypothetical protein [Clostridiaceae bacterium]